MQRIEEKIRRLIDQSGAASVGVAVFDCRSGRRILVNAETPFHAASTMKICVMMEVFRQARQGLFSLDDVILVRNEFLSIVDQSKFFLSIADDSETDLYTLLDRSLPIRDLVTRMITLSSNLATNILIELVAAQKVTDFMSELGAEALLICRGVEDSKAFAHGLNNSATALGLMQILTKLAFHQVVSEEASEAMIAIMKQQKFNEGIPSCLPVEVPVAHKTGSIGLLYHDAAIIYPPDREPYVLVVMTRGLAEDREAPALVSLISKLIYENQQKWG
jgi:beta-lactamase class A